MYYTDGAFEIRNRRNGRPYVAIGDKDARRLGNISKSWKVQRDILDDTVYIMPEKARLFTNGVHRQKTKVTTIRVDSEEWEEYVKLCKALGTSTCRELRLFIHLKLAEARYPQTTRRLPGVG